MKLVNKYNIGNKVQNRSTYIYNINQWARQNPQRVFDDDFKAQRQYLDDTTWRIVLDFNPDIKVGDRKYNMLPTKYKADLEKSSVKSAIEENGAPIAGGLMLAATAPIWAPYADRMWQISKWGSKAPGIFGRMPSLAAVESTVSRPWLTPGLGRLADAAVAGYFGYEGAKGFNDQYKNGNLNIKTLENLGNTVLNGVSMLPAVATIKEVPAILRALRPKTLGRNLFRQFSRIYPKIRVHQLQEINQDVEAQIQANIVKDFANREVAKAVESYNLPTRFLNSSLTYGDFAWPNYSTGELVSGNIPKNYTNYITNGKLNFEVSEPSWLHGANLGDITFKVTPPEIRRSANAGDIEALRRVLQNNIKFLENYIPGSKVYGSARSVADGAITLIPKDIEVMLTEDAFKAFKILHPEANIGAINDFGTAKYYINQSWGDHGVIDLNIISVDKYGYGNKRAMSVYQQYFPKEYQNTVRLLSEGKFTPMYDNTSFPMLDMNGNPISAQQLINAYNPQESTILDSFLANFTISRKAKHRFRSIEYLAGDRPDLVHNVLQRYSNMITGGNGKLLPRLTFGTAAENEALLRSIGLRGDVTTIAQDPAKMQNALDAWYLTESGMAGRAAQPGDVKEGNVADWAKTLRNFSKWLYTGVNGNASGFGQNWTAGADSGAGRQLKGYLMPYIKGLFNGMRAEDAVQILKRTMLHPDYKITQEEANIINNIYHKYEVNTTDFKAGDNGQEILHNTQQFGKNVYDANKEISERLGFNFATGKPYQFHGDLTPYYVGSMRDFDFSPEKATRDIIGIARYDGEGAFEYMPSWRDRFDALDNRNMPSIYDVVHRDKIHAADGKLSASRKNRNDRFYKLLEKTNVSDDNVVKGAAAGIVGTPLGVIGGMLHSILSNDTSPYSFNENFKFYNLANQLGGVSDFEFGKTSKDKDFIIVKNKEAYFKLPLWLREELQDRFIIKFE